MIRNAFSLLEIIIATAVLAASAMVLSSLIGLGTKYGNRAEERTLAVSQAESLMDEFLARLHHTNGSAEESTGELLGPPLRRFRIRVTPFEVGTANSNRNGESVSGRSGGLLSVTVEVFETSGSNISAQAKPLVEISRLIRQPQNASASATSGMLMGAATGTELLVAGASE